MDRKVGISSRQWGKLSDWRMGNQGLEVALRNYLQGPESISAPGWRQRMMLSPAGHRIPPLSLCRLGSQAFQPLWDLLAQVTWHLGNHRNSCSWKLPLGSRQPAVSTTKGYSLRWISWQLSAHSSCNLGLEISKATVITRPKTDGKASHIRKRRIWFFITGWDTLYGYKAVLWKLSVDLLSRHQS